MKIAIALFLLFLVGCAVDPVTEKYYEAERACRNAHGHMFILSPTGEIRRGIPDEHDRYYCRLGASNIIF